MEEQEEEKEEKQEESKQSSRGGHMLRSLLISELLAVLADIVGHGVNNVFQHTLLEGCHSPNNRCEHALALGDVFTTVILPLGESEKKLTNTRRTNTKISSSYQSSRTTVKVGAIPH